MKSSILQLRIISLILICCAQYSVWSQAYFANGDAISIGGDCYQLTPEANTKSGTVWYANKLNLQQNFDLEFSMNLGRLDASGADGIVFVLQRNSNTSLGSSGGGIGYEGLTPSLGIEFDTWQNTNVNDPSYDHMSIFKNGIMNHYSPNCLTPTVAASATSANIEDGADHLVRVRWVAGAKNLSVWFDCVLRLSLQYDIQGQIFSNNSDVYWGFTSATGGAVNKHVVCLSDDILVPDSVQICFGDTVRINAKASSNDTYTWSPSLYLSSSTQKNPTCFPPSSQYFYVTYLNQCRVAVTDSVYVKVIDKLAIDFASNDSIQCLTDNEFIFTNRSNIAGGSQSSVWKFKDGTLPSNEDTLVKSYSKPGNYDITLVVNSTIGCSDSLTKSVTVVPQPEANFSLDSVGKSCFEFPFINASTDNDIASLWTIGYSNANATRFTLKNPTIQLDKLVDSIYACLRVTDTFGCSDSVCRVFPNTYVETLDIYNVFTPNNDSYNDSYFVSIEGYSDFKLTIFNRWGEHVFETQDPKEGWNGTFKNTGQVLPNGTYFYIVDYSMLCSQKNERVSGIIDLIRSN